MEVIYHLDHDADRQKLECFKCAEDMFLVLWNLREQIRRDSKDELMVHSQKYYRELLLALEESGVNLDYINDHPNIIFEEED